MKRKSIKVLRIKQLKKTKSADGVESNERFSLIETGEHFCIVTLKEGETVLKDQAGNITQVGKVKLNDEIVALEREIESANGKVNQFYYEPSDSVEGYIAREANRDLDNKIAQAKLISTAKISQELTAMGFDAKAALATI